jgi:hypothetical protein
MTDQRFTLQGGMSTMSDSKELTPAPAADPQDSQSLRTLAAENGRHSGRDLLGPMPQLACDVIDVVSHRLNNPLAVVIANIQFVCCRAGLKGDLASALEDAAAAANTLAAEVAALTKHKG